MKLLLPSVGVTNDSIRKALLELLGKPVEECRAVQISTALYASPSGPEDAYEMAKYYGEWAGRLSAPWSLRPCPLSRRSIGCRSSSLRTPSW